MPKQRNNLHDIYNRSNVSKKLRSSRNARYRDRHPRTRINTSGENFRRLVLVENRSVSINDLEQDNSGKNELNEYSMDVCQFVTDEVGHSYDASQQYEMMQINTSQNSLTEYVEHDDGDTYVDVDDNDDELYVDNNNDDDDNEVECNADDEVNSNILRDEESLLFRHQERTLSNRDIAIILCLIKRRHKCSNHLIVDIIRLLNKVVPDKSIVPKSIYDIRKLLNINSGQVKGTEKQSTTIIICQICEAVQTSNKKCSNELCNIDNSYVKPPFVYTWFNIRSQFEQIIGREKNMIFASSSNPMVRSTTLKNILDGRLFKHVLCNEIVDDTTKLFTLSLSTDGVQLGSSSIKSLWLITISINEIDAAHRFLLNNIIICGINSCYRKPTRKIMNFMITPIFQQLKLLEQGGFCDIDGQMNLYKVFLIGSINDKPANALVQNIPEPNAAYGCSKCEIQGVTIPSHTIVMPKTKGAEDIRNKHKTTHIRVFPTSFKGTPSRLRSSENYEKALLELQKQRMKNPNLSEQQQLILRKGYLGPCKLASLRYFDHGQSFLSDTLHTVYGGATKRLLAMFFEKKLCTVEKNWTIHSEVEKINRKIEQYIAPSSTIRLPRPINLYTRYKASEFRSILLVYYNIFENILPEKYYTHLKQLVFALHIGEGRQISSDKLDEMHILLQYFVNQFKILYGLRHVVNNIHSLIHLAETVRDYGPVQGYSTFNYESVLGGITATIHGTKNQEKEIYNNLQMLKESNYLATVSQNSSLYELMIQFLGGKCYIGNEQNNYFILSKPVIESSHEKNNDEADETKSILINQFNRCIYKNVLYNSHDFKKSDCAILYHDLDRNKSQYAIIDKFIQRKNENNSIWFQVYDLTNWHHDFLYIGTMKFECENVLIGELSKCSKRIHPSAVIEKVFALINTHKITVIRLPNLTESS